MAIDNGKIIKVCIDMQEEENKIVANQNSIQSIRRALNQICITKIQKSNDKGGFDMVDSEIFDSSLNEKMSDARRQAIYDKNMKLWTDHKTDSKV